VQENYNAQQAALRLSVALDSRDSVLPWRQTLDFKSQEASRVRFPGVCAVALWLPVCPALVIPLLCSLSF
jgi:hypothetical protein